MLPGWSQIGFGQAVWFAHLVALTLFSMVLHCITVKSVTSIS